MPERQIQINFPDKDRGFICPCCGLFCKRYTRNFNSGMAIALLCLYRNKHKGFIHLENTLSEEGYNRCGDASYLKWYGFIKPLNEKRKDGSNRNGMYQITGTGIMVCELKMMFQSKFIIFNNHLEGFSGKEITILEALNEKFNYNNLMSIQEPLPA